jgi:hypothetical protein
MAFRLLRRARRSRHYSSDSASVGGRMFCPPPPRASSWKIPTILASSHYLIPHSLSLTRFTQAFVVPSIGRPALLAASPTTTSLDASRINAKQEKRKRNRENMRKFKKGGKKGTSKKKMMRKLQSGAARQVGGCFFRVFCTALVCVFRVFAKYFLLTQSHRSFCFFIMTNTAVLKG